MVDRAPDLAGLRANGLHLLAADRWRRVGRPIPEQLLVDERGAALATLMAPVLLARVRNILDGPIILLKGPEVAAHYPNPALRPFGDLDLLVRDADAAQRALVAAGFIPQGSPDRYVGHHHRQPLRWTGTPLLVEIHRSPAWLHWMTPPTNDELFTVAIPGSTGVDGLLALPDSYHALLIAAHSWQHGPLPRLLDLIDVALITEGADAVALNALARRWNLERVWSTTTRTSATLVGGESVSCWPLRLWARHLNQYRERTTFEARLARWFIGSLGAPSPGSAVRSIASTISAEVRPRPGERWPARLARVGRVAHQARVPVVDHN